MIHRRALCEALAAAPFLATPALLRSAFAEEVSSVVLVSQHGLPYLPLMVMDTLKLVEKHAGKAGITSLKPEYKTLGGTQSLIDALLSGQMNFGVTGVPGLATLWDKTAGTANEVRALSAVQSMPFMLVTNRESIKTIKDFTDKDKIAIPSVKISTQAIMLQMAAAKAFGEKDFAKLDPLTVTLSHPDATLAFINNTAGVNAHFSSSPFYEQEIKAPGAHLVTTNYDILGGRATAVVITANGKFRDANPKAYKAFYDGLSEAIDTINKDKRAASKLYLEAAHDTKNSVDDIFAIINDKDYAYTLKPEKVFATAQFMAKIGSIKQSPKAIGDLFFPEIAGLRGD